MDENTNPEPLKSNIVETSGYLQHLNRIDQVCPSCGHCPTCGRGPGFTYYGPWWGIQVPPTVMCNTTGTLGDTKVIID